MLRTFVFIAALAFYHQPFLTPVQTSEAAARLRQAAERFQQARYAEAAALAQQARTLDAQLLPAWKLAGLALQLAGKAAEAENEFTQAAQRFPADPELWLQLARVRYQRGALPAAEEAVRQALKLQPDYADAHAQLGLTREAALDYAQALAGYQRAIVLNQQQGREKVLPLYQAALLLGKQGQAAAALDLLNRALNVESRSAELRLARGRTHEQLGQPREAAEDYRQAVALNGDAQARAALARLQSGATASAAQPARHAAAPSPAIRLRAVKLAFTLHNSAAPEKYLVETMLGGVAAFDYDNDGNTDLFFANGAALPSLRKTEPAHWNRLLRNRGDGTFSDVTESAAVRGALKGEGYAMGAAAADYDNDGDQDLFVTGVNRFTLYRNEGGGRFADVTTASQLGQSAQHWSVSAAWFDYDNDGWLDLFVVNYVKWRPGLDPVCGSTKVRTYCLPDKYEARASQLFRNRGDGTFSDVSEASGIAALPGKGMGVAIGDYDEDGFTDVFVANDTLPNFLWRNHRRGSFDEIGLAAGIAFNDSGRAVSSMGVDFRDADNDGRPDAVVTALEGETFPFFRNLGQGFFHDATWSSGLGAASIRRSGWGLGLFDLNNDGHKDLFTANSHVNDRIEELTGQSYRQPLGIFLNTGNGQFADATRTASEDVLHAQARRGCAFADFNNDGKMDAVTTALHASAEIWLNESDSAQHWLAVRLIGQRSNRDGIGARLKLVTANGRTQFNHVTTSVGYASSSEPRVHFGLGAETQVKLLEIRWPSGATQQLSNVATNRLLTLREPVS